MPQLGRHPHFDDRSRSYPIRTLLPARALRTARIWDVLGPFPLDQQAEGACVGMGWSAELAADPVVIPVPDVSFAFRLYELAREQDRLMGNYWGDGASVLAGAKAAAAKGWVAQYRWAFSIDDVIDTLVAHGPVVLGVPWFSDMYRTDANGLVKVGGDLVGGHCLLAYGYLPGTDHGPVVLLLNSWGDSYGIHGRASIKVDDLARLLADDGEACIAVDQLPAPPRPRPRLPWWRRFWGCVRGR